MSSFMNSSNRQKSSSKPSKSELIKLFTSLGMTLTENEEAFNELDVDQRLFQNRLRKHLKASPENTPKLLKQLEEYLEEELNFLVALFPTKNTINCSNSHSSNQDTLIKILIEMDEVQSSLFEYLIGKITQYSEENADKKIFNLQINVPSYILNQFRYQPKIIDSEELCRKFIELIYLISSIGIKRELITCLPDIIGDNKHEEVAAELENLLTETDLVACILETLKCLQLKEATQREFVEKLLVNYSIINEEDVAPLVKYLFKTALSLNSLELLDKIRTKIDFSELSVEDNRFLLFDVLREYFQISAKLSELYTTLLTTHFSSNNSDQKFLTIDLLVITVIYSLPQSIKSIDALFKKLIKNHWVQITSEHVKSLFTYGSGVTKEIFEPICQLAKSFIINLNREISQIACLIYKHGFELLEVKYKQIIVNNLVDHIISSVSVERDNGFDILYELALNSTKNGSKNSLHQFTIVLKMLLDFIEYFNLSQIRKLYFIMCSLAYEKTDSSIASTNRNTSGSGESVIQDTLHIMINKQLTSNQLRYKQMGIMGALMMIKCMSDKLSAKNVADDAFRTIRVEINNIWMMIDECSQNSPALMSLFADNLASLIRSGGIAPKIENLFKENLGALMKTLFKLDPALLAKLKEQCESLFQLGFEFGLDSCAQGALSLYAQCKSEIEINKNLVLFNSKEEVMTRPVSPVLNASTFRLMAALERKDLGELSGYIGLPIMSLSLPDLMGFCEEAGLNKFVNLFAENERRLVCDLVFYVINWFTELVNAFCVNANRANCEATTEKLIARLRTILDLRQVLRHLLPSIRFYKPPIAIFGLNAEVPFTSTLFKKKDVGKKGAKGSVAPLKKKIRKVAPKKATQVGSDDENEADATGRDRSMLDSIIDDMIDDEVPSKGKMSLVDTNADDVDLSKVSICFREFDIDLVNLACLPLSLNGGRGDETSFSSGSQKRAALTPDLLMFIMSDVNEKLAVLLKSSEQSTFMHQPKETKIGVYQQLNPVNAHDLVDKLLNSCMNKLLEHLNNIYEHFKAIEERNDGMRDCAEFFSDNNLVLMQCFNQLLKFLLMIFKWIDSSSSKENFIEEAICRLAKQNPVDKSFEINAIKYLHKFKEVIFELPSANYLVTLIDLLSNKLMPKCINHQSVNEPKFKQIISDMCMEILQTEFYSNAKPRVDKRLNTDAIGNLLKILFKNSKTSFKIVESLTCIITSDDFMECRDNYGNYPTLKLAFAAYFRALLEETVNRLKSLDLLNTKNPEVNLPKLPEMSDSIRRAVKVHCALVTLNRHRCFRDINLMSVFKNSKLFLEVFMRNSMPWIDQAFEQSKEVVVEMLQQLQKSVIYLQDICMSKSNAALEKTTPAFMKTVEAFTLRVKLMLCVNGCDNAFESNLHSSKVKEANFLKVGKKAKAGKENANPKRKRGAKNDDNDGSGEENEVESDEESGDSAVEDDEDDTNDGQETDDGSDEDD